ncbi:MAG: (2Fe-2S) ferredoxin domain-containing protein [Erysipelotrichaceae bacterium]|nr:(2Fe-2S) ferredoxin domain-containing protein [Erysipelotrichaceae bacterium]
MKSLDDLKKMREQALKKVEMRDVDKKYRIVVGMATCGIAAGARPVLNKFIEEIANNDYPCVVTQTGCIGLCAYEPIVEVFNRDDQSKTTYVHVNPEKAVSILQNHILKDRIVTELTIDNYQK